MFLQNIKFKYVGGIFIVKYENKKHPLDVGFKFLSQKFLMGLLAVFMLHVEIKELLSTNFINQKYDRIRLDFAFMSKEDRVYDLEFESKTPGFKEHIRYAIYMLCLYAKFKKPVELYVILGRNARIPKKPKIPPFIKKEYIHYIPLYTFDGDEILNNIKKKHTNNERLTEKEIALLSLIPCFSTKKGYNDYLIKAAELIIDLNDDSEIIDDISVSFILFAQLVVDIETQDKIRGIFTMRKGAIQRYGIEQREEGEKRGVKIGEMNERIKIATQMKLNGYDFNEIESLTGLTRIEFNQL